MSDAQSVILIGKLILGSCLAIFAVAAFALDALEGISKKLNFLLGEKDTKEGGKK